MVVISTNDFHLAKDAVGTSLRHPQQQRSTIDAATIITTLVVGHIFSLSTNILAIVRIHYHLPLLP